MVKSGDKNETSLQEAISHPVTASVAKQSLSRGDAVAVAISRTPVPTFGTEITSSALRASS